MTTLRPNATWTWIAVTVWSLSMIWLAIKTGPQHDYVAYLSQWRLVLSGSNPWSTTNAYGPLHNILALLLPLSPLGPKIFMVVVLLIANALLLWEFHRSGDIDRIWGTYLLAVPTNVLVISMAMTYTLNDTLVAALVVFAIIARHRSAMVVAGGFLGLAVLLKYYPIVLVPLFALDAGRFRLRLILAATVVTSLGLAASTLVWGDATFTAVSFATDRDQKILSILSALSSYPSLIGGRSVVDFLIRTNIGFVAVTGLLSTLIAWKEKMHWLEASVLGLLSVLVVYKVGHPQFFLPWLFLVAALPLAATSSCRMLAWVCLPMVLFFSAFQWGYAYGSDGYNEILGSIRKHVGFVAFALSIMTIVAFFIGRRSLKSSSIQDSCGPDPIR